MNHIRLLVALAAIALSTAAMACDDEDDAGPPERASVVQALLDGVAAQHA
ncbi:hypothetical protein [Ramlibacter sp. AN1133]